MDRFFSAINRTTSAISASMAFSRVRASGAGRSPDHRSYLSAVFNLCGKPSYIFRVRRSLAGECPRNCRFPCHIGCIGSRRSFRALPAERLGCAPASRQEPQMPRYFFHIHDGHSIRDPEHRTRHAALGTCRLERVGAKFWDEKGLEA
jgi:hypothetical protein